MRGPNTRREHFENLAFWTALLTILTIIDGAIVIEIIGRWRAM